MAKESIVVDNKESILVVDNEKDICTVLVAQLRRTGYDARFALSGELALEEMRRAPAKLVIVDLKMPGMNGLELIEAMARTWPNVPAMMISARGEIPDVVKAMKAGAKEFLQKPFDQSELLERVNDILDAWVRPQPPTVAPSMARVHELATMVAKMKRMTVLILGETGVGKEVLAKKIHDLSGRSGEFVAANCAESNDQLVLSDLFGHEKGAFTDAYAQRRGLVERAEGGTLLLDEIGDWNSNLQLKLLRFLESREFTRVGGTKTMKADVRILIATNRNLRTRVASGEFREDLYYRINDLEIVVPPLRERQDEIPRLVKTFAREMWEEHDMDASLTPEAISAMCAQPWRGNVRELKSVVRRAIMFSGGGTIDVAQVREALKAEGEPVAASGTLDSILDDATRRAIQGALGRTDHNVTRAAKELAISRRHFYNLMEKLGLGQRV
jgi:DNA-binding NtrC family response regulator